MGNNVVFLGGKPGNMKNVFALLLVSALMVSCKSQPAANSVTDAAGFQKGMTGPGVQVLDVRTAGEFQSGHIKNALLADWTNQQQFMDRIVYVDKDKPVYIYCLGGGRSNAAAKWMRSNGFTNVVELQGGINAWKNAGMPVEGSSNEPQITLEQYMASIPPDKTVLVDFGAEWCPPCIKMKPVIDELEKDGGFVLLKIDAGVHTNLMKELNIEPIPEFIVYKQGKETWRKQGVISKEELAAQLK